MYVKKFLALIICLAITAGMFIVPLMVQAEGEKAVWDGSTIDYTWYDGKESPYKISTPAQFAAFGNILNKMDGHNDRFAGKTIQLAADLDMGGKPFRAMGGHADDMVFAGTFDGNGHVISNLNITQAGLSSNYVALFSRLSGGTIRNLGLEGVTVDVPNAANRAAFVGLLLDGSVPATVENCFVRDADIKLTMPLATDGTVGGFVADVRDYPQSSPNTIKNCYTVNVGISRKSGEGNAVQRGFGNFTGVSNGGAFINCYSGGTQAPSDGLLASGITPFGVYLNTSVTDTNCYSDCYSDDSVFDWLIANAGWKRGGSKVSTADLKGKTGSVALGAEFVKAENDFYNAGYPFLKWEEKYLKNSNQIPPTGPLTVKSQEEAENQRYNVTLSEITGAEYRYVTYGAPGAWQDSNIFTNLPSGKYIFEARMPENETHYPSQAIVADEITLGDLSVWNGVSADYSWYDNHSASYTISTAAQFAAFGNILNKLDGRNDRFAGKTIQLATDLDMGNQPFRAMGGGKDDMVFAGTFDGQGHIISNLNIAEAGLNSEYVALFCRLSGGTIRGLGLEGVTVNVPSAMHQAAFVGQLLDGTGQSTVENCFVRDVEFIINDTIENRRIGGFVAVAADWPSPPLYHSITNCYAVNVAFKGSGSNTWALGYFAGPSDGGKFTNCYSGGTLNAEGFSADTFGRFGTNAQANNCYSDGADSGEIREPGHFKTVDTKISTAALKSNENMGDGFVQIPDIYYNYGYPVLAWEEDRAEAVEGSFTMHKITDSLSGEAGEDITPTAFSDTYDAAANSVFDIVFNQDVNLSTVTAENITFNGKPADRVEIESANKRRVRVHLSALTPLTRGRLKVFGVKNPDGKYLKNMELCFTTIGATDNTPVISSFELVENYSTPDEIPVPQESDLAGKTITAVAGGLYNNTDATHSYTLMLVHYNEKGIVEDVAINTYELGAHEYISEKGTSSAGGNAEPTPVKLDITVPAGSKGHTVKAFAWNMNTLEPLCKSLEACDHPLKLLIVGNSITKHGPNPDIGWLHDWGMAATAESKDYVHQLAAKAETVAPVTLKMVNSYDFEMYFYDFSKFDSGKYQEFFDFEPDIIICTIGANIKNPEPEGNDGVLTDIHFDKNYYKNIIDFFNKNGKAKVIVGTTIFTAEGGEVQTAIKAYAEENGVPYVKMNDMDDEKYSAKPYKDQFPANVSEGVLLHPGDAGMAEMANRLWVALKPAMEQLLADSADGTEK